MFSCAESPDKLRDMMKILNNAVCKWDPAARANVQIGFECVIMLNKLKQTNKRTVTV